MKIKITEYGLSKKAGGWDGIGDSGTDAWLGNHSNLLNTSSCALTRSAQDLLHAMPGDLLKVKFNERYVYYVTFDDRAPEDDPRVDMYFPFVRPVEFNHLSDFADVTIFQKAIQGA